MLNRSGPKPLYLQLEEIIRKQISDRELKFHEAIPSENELSRIYNLSRMTVRAVITKLVSDDLLYRVPGKGTFVAEPKIMTTPLTQKGIREQLEDMGYETGTTVIEKKIEPAPPDIASELGLPADEPVYKLERVRYANGEPLGLDLSYIPVGLCSDLLAKDLDLEPLCDILEKHYGIVAKRGIETLESYSAASKEMKYLKVAKGSSLLLLKYTMFSQAGTPFECSRVIFRGDRIKLKFSFSR